MMRSRKSSGFTLVELLTVLAIMAILATLVLMSPGPWKASSVTTASNVVLEDMALAREVAVSSNQPAEVWFLSAQGTTQVNAVRTYLVDESGNYTPNSPVHRLPANMIIDSGSYLSPILVAGNVKSWASAGAQPLIPGYSNNYNAWYVRFMPDGSTTLASTQQWYVTLHELRFGDQLTALPVNYGMISLDPLTGSVRLYRP